jgi:hypothetical protein
MSVRQYSRLGPPLLHKRLGRFNWTGGPQWREREPDVHHRSGVAAWRRRRSRVTRRPRGLIGMTDQGPRRVGWVVVALGAVALGILALYLVSGSSGVAQTDETWWYVATFVSPFLSGSAASAIGILLMLVAAFRLVDVRVSRAARATGMGCLLAGGLRCELFRPHLSPRAA